MSMNMSPSPVVFLDKLEIEAFQTLLAYSDRVEQQRIRIPH